VGGKDASVSPVVLGVDGEEEVLIVTPRRLGMIRIWSYWSFVILLILAILYFSIGILKAAEYQCPVSIDRSPYGIYKAL
jgi:hypothetical protein